MRLIARLAIALLVVTTPVPALAADDRPITEWKVPWPDSRPRDPFTVDGKTVWFCGQVGHYLGRLEVDSGKFSKVDLPDLAGPHNLVIDDEGSVWYAGNLKGYIGRLDPANGAIEKIAIPDPAAADPHTLVFDAKGDIWFTVQGGNFVGRLARAERKIDLVAVPTPLARPYGIAVAPDESVWVVLFGSNKLATIEPLRLGLTEIELPRVEARPRRIAITTDGRIWYADHAAGQLGVYSPLSGEFTEWPLPGGADAQPYAMAVDDADRIWLVETGVKPNRFVGFDPATEEFLGTTAIPSGAGSVRHMQYHPGSGSIWFGTDANTIGRFQLPSG